MMRVLAAVLGAVLAGTAHGAEGEDWQTWNDCDDPVDDAEVSSMSGRRLSEVLTRDELKDAHQIVFINSETGKLEVNHNATVWDALLTAHQEVNLIVTYGLGQSGMSTMASMLACAMNGADEATTTLFPAQRAESCSEKGCHLDWPATLGIWATDPFTYRGPGGAGEEKTYMILDTQGMDAAHQLIEGLSTKLYNDANVKMLAMLSEVASEFIYVSRNAASMVTGSEYDGIGVTLKSTRENLVRTGPEYASNASKTLNIRSTNHPGMLFVTREILGSDVVKSDNFTQDTTLWDGYTYVNYDSVTTDDPDFGALLEANFKTHSVEYQGQTKEVAWNYNPLPDMNNVIGGDNTFMWSQKSLPFPLEQGASCREYKKMNNFKCKRLSGDGQPTPSAPPTYKLMIDGLAEQIYNHAPVRQVMWGDMATAADLTGSRLKSFLEAGVMEINKAGVVADNELWRLIAEDRCMVDLNNEIQTYYSRKRDELALIVDEVKADAALAHLIPPGTPAIDEFGIATRNATIEATWNTAAEQFSTVVDSFFLQNTLLVSVRSSCTAEAYGIFELISLEAARLLQDMARLGQVAIVRRRESEIKDLTDQLEALEAEYDALWWQANLPYMIALGFIALAVCYIFTRMFAQVCTTARSCLMCCDDLTTQEHTHKVVLTGPGGMELTGVRRTEAPRIPGIAIAPAVVPMGADPAVHQRIEELEAVVMQLAARVPHTELRAMGHERYSPDNKV